MYGYVATALKPTAVSHAITCNRTSPTEKNLIIARGNFIEVHTFRDNGLQQEQELTIYGRIASLNCHRISQLNLDVLIVLTEKKSFCILGYDTASRKVITRATGNLKEPLGRDMPNMRTYVDPESTVIAISIYQGSLKVIPIDGPNLKEAFNARLDVLLHIDMKFLFGCPKPTIAVLYEDNRHVKRIRSYVVDQREKDLQPGPVRYDNVDNGAKFLIPVPAPIFGLVVVATNSISYYNGADNVKSVVIDGCEMTSYCRVDSDGTRFLLGDERGRLYVLVLIKAVVSGATIIRSLAIDYVGSTSISECLCYLSNGYLYVGSYFGNSLLVKLRDQSIDHDENLNASTSSKSGYNRSSVNSSFVDLVETYQNVGPIVDMVVVATERTGHNRIVTCSGKLQDGSLRVISSGIGIRELVSSHDPHYTIIR